MRLKLQKTKHYKIIFNLTFPKLHLGKDKGTKKQKKKKTMVENSANGDHQSMTLLIIYTNSHKQSQCTDSASTCNKNRSKAKCDSC
jgi:hypothetical protein